LTSQNNPDFPVVAANDVHFSPPDHEAHDVMIYIGTGSMVIDEDRMRYTSKFISKRLRKCAISKTSPKLATIPPHR
jgi:DNA polymerase III alpha subunit